MNNHGKIILKSRYLRAGSRQHSEHLIRYIAKREGVQKIDNTWKHQSATKEQKKLIEELVRDFPETKDSFEYQDYISKPSKGTASEFISRAIDDNVDLIGKRENYVSYIAKRPRTERHGAHGLFTDADVPINLSKVAKEVANHEGNVWTHIISLRREDADRLGYDNAYAWRNLLRSQAETIAENMKIRLPIYAGTLPTMTRAIIPMFTWWFTPQERTLSHQAGYPQHQGSLCKANLPP